MSLMTVAILCFSDTTGIVVDYCGNYIFQYIFILFSVGWD